MLVSRSSVMDCASMGASHGSSRTGAAVVTGDDAFKEGTPRMEAKPEPEIDLLTVDTTPRKVLIVEDAIELAEVIAATLERLDIETFHASHVEAALAIYDAQHPDLILLDIGLPDKTGWKLLDAIKSQANTRAPMVIVISAHGDPANRLMGKLQGVQSYLVKPFTPDEVEDIVQKAFRGALTWVDTEVSDSAAGLDSVSSDR